jgi:hypothetical protein
MPSIANKPFMLSVVMLNVVMLYVMAPLKGVFIKTIGGGGELPSVYLYSMMLATDKVTFLNLILHCQGSCSRITLPLLKRKL